MIYNYTKCESVIAKVMADLNISESNMRVTDMREWIFEAVDKIGAPMLYITKESGVDGEPVLEIRDRQIPLPLGVQVINGLAYSKNPTGPWIPMRNDTGIFHGKNVKGAEHYTPKQDMQYKEFTSKSQLYTINGVKWLEKAVAANDPDVTYFIKPGWIVTNKDEGYIRISYKTIATDERGYPLVPDLTSYQEAVYWYIVMKLSFPKFLNGQLGGKGRGANLNAYFYIQQQWNFYRNQAYAEAMMPTASDMESIKNEWNKLIPEWDSDQQFFSKVGQEQTVINDYYYGY